MSDKDLKRIYRYMGWCSHSDIWRDGKFFCVKCRKGLSDRVNTCFPLDSNTAWLCVQEIEWRFDIKEFSAFVFDTRLHGKEDANLSLWLMNPTNFFNCMAKWLEGREK